MSTPVFPAPRRIRRAGSLSPCAALHSLTFPAAWTDALLPGARFIQERLQQPVNLRATASGEASRAGDIFCTRCPTLDAPEAYRIDATQPSRILIEAAAPVGLFRAWTTAVDLLSGGSDNAKSGYRIDDSPALAERGFMLDISRCKVPTMPRLFALVDALAALKINQLQLYTEHTFAFAGHETVWRNSGAMTPDQILELDRYCRDRFIELVPNFNSFGHFERWLRHPAYKPLAECPDGFISGWGTWYDRGSTLTPGTRALELLDELYGQLLPQFSSGRFNIGCDETWELGQGKSAARCKRQGRTSVYLDFIRRLHRLSERHGRTPMIWADIIFHEPERLAELPQPLTALAWGYEASHPFPSQAKALAQTGIPFSLCPGTSSWRSLTGRTDNALRNSRAAAKHAVAQGGLGLLQTDWGDEGHHQPDPIRWLPLAYAAGQGWQPQRNAAVAGAVAGANRLWAQDKHNGTLPWLADLGNVYRHLTPSLDNSTPFFHALFQKKHKVETLLAFSKAQWQAAQNELEELRERFATEVRPGGTDAALIRSECRLALDFTRAACQRALAHHGNPKQETQAQRALPDLIDRHKQVWLARNRRGGLSESVRHLQRER